MDATAKGTGRETDRRASPQIARRGGRALALDYLSSPAFGGCQCVAPRGRTTRADSEYRLGDARLRLPTDHQRTAATRSDSQSQARFALATRGQSALSAAASVCAHHRFQSLVAGLSQSGARIGAFKHQSTLGRQTLLTSGCGGSLFISRLSSTLTVGAASAGRSRVTSIRN